MAPGEVTRVTDVPEAVDGRRIGTGSGPAVGEIDAIDGQARQFSGVHEGAQTARLPAECAGAVEGKGRGNRRGDRATSAASWRRRAGGRGRVRACRCHGWRPWGGRI